VEIIAIVGSHYERFQPLFADIDKLITIGGMVIRSSSIIPEMREAFFKCNACKNCVTVEIDRGRIAEPTLCTHCNTNHSFALVHNRSHFSDKQMIKLQESPGLFGSVSID
jgi:DNA replication licensing factor MCM4